MFLSKPVLGLVLISVAPAAQTFVGPVPYLSRADSPFPDCVTLETFEDHLFNLPGVSSDVGGVTSVVFGPSIHDSVDADDGAIDGSGLMGDSFFATSPITFTFDDTVLGRFPLRVGVVWTDGAGTTSFEAFDRNGQSLGTVGPVALADASNNGETAEDNFFGITYLDGVSAIRISNTSGGIEVDHLQYAFEVAPAILASETVRLGTPPNPNVFRPSLATAPILGSPWTPYVDHTSFATAATLDLVIIDTRPGINIPRAFGTLLCPIPGPDQVFTVSAGTPFALFIPNECSLAGLAACSQAGSLTPGVGLELTNALDLVLGTH